MSYKALLDNLDDQTTLLILSNLTQDLREDIPEEEAKAIRSEEDARLAIISFLNALGENTGHLSATTIIPDDADVKTVGRGMLELLLNDETARSRTQDLIAHPPKEEQMSVELAIAGAVILGALITWLQTKVKIKIHRKDGKTEFEFEMIKDATDASTMKELAQSLMALLKRPL